MKLQAAWFLLIQTIATAPLLCSSYSASWRNDYLPYERRIPRDIMVEVINNLGLSLLDVHNHHNDNNIAISPYGATSVLVALVEGLVGEAAYEIRQAINLPHDLAVVRVGLRDIHRHLKSYFIPKEGFLAGLTLNHDNITLHREYESILKFYGYDIESFNNGVYPGTSTTTESGVTTEPSTTTEGTTTARTTRRIPDPTDEISEGTTSKKVPTRATTSGDSEQTETRLPSTTASIAETTVEARTVEEEATTTELQTKISTVTAETTLTTEESSTNNSKIDSDAIINQDSTTKSATETFPPSTTMISETTTTVVASESTSASTTIIAETEASAVETSTSVVVSETTSAVVQSNSTSTTIIAQTEATAIETSTSVGVPETTSAVVSTTMQEKDISENLITNDGDGGVITTSEGTTKLAEETTTFLSTTVSTDLSDLMGEESNFIEINANITFPQGGRTRRSVIDYLIARYYDNYYIHSNRRYLPQVDYPKYHPQEPYTFLINGQYRESNINFMTYDTVLPFYYIPGLDAMALSFPLDSNMYYLLLILPVDEQGIDKLVHDFRKITTLERIVQNLKYTHVKALIPSFKLKGYVILTPSLQKLCIKRIFEPRHADFSQLTPEKDIYVTNIEQAVTVNIRNYAETNGVSGRNMPTNRPVEFRADHPFLYFVMDSTIHVNLMAGKIINPLNSRIR